MVKITLKWVMASNRALGGTTLKQIFTINLQARANQYYLRIDTLLTVMKTEMGCENVQINVGLGEKSVQNVLKGKKKKYKKTCKNKPDSDSLLVIVVVE